MNNPAQLTHRPRASRQPGSAVSRVRATELPESLATLYRPGWSLPGAFYSDPVIYRLDLDRVDANMRTRTRGSSDEDRQQKLFHGRPLIFRR